MVDPKIPASSIYSHMVGFTDNAPNTSSYAAASTENERTASRHIGNLEPHSLLTPDLMRASCRVPDLEGKTDLDRRTGWSALPPWLPSTPTAKGYAPRFTPPTPLPRGASRAALPYGEARTPIPKKMCKQYRLLRCCRRPLCHRGLRHLHGCHAVQQKPMRSCPIPRCPPSMPSRCGCRLSRCAGHRNRCGYHLCFRPPAW